MEDEASLARLLGDFSRLQGNKVLVHGGGKSATRMAARLGIETQMVEGRRVTDEAMLDVVTMVYAGMVNKHIVAALQALGVNALGLTGADLNLIRSVKRPAAPIDYGWVGDVEQVDVDVLDNLIEQKVVPVVAPLTHDGKGNLLNTNADTIAGELSKALVRDFAVTLIYCFDKPGVMRNENDPHSIIRLLTREAYYKYREQGVIQGGMIPKLDNAFAALDAGLECVRITQAHTILLPAEGTTILK